MPVCNAFLFRKYRSLEVREIQVVEIIQYLQDVVLGWYWRRGNIREEGEGVTQDYVYITVDWVHMLQSYSFIALGPDVPII